MSVNSKGVNRRKRGNNRQERDTNQPMRHWYLHPTKGWKRERPFARRVIDAKHNDWKLFQKGLKEKKDAKAE